MKTCAHGITPSRDCKECKAAYHREWRKKNPDACRAATRRWRKRHPKHSNKIQKASKSRRLDRVHARLGGSCSCCGESKRSMLDIDHIHGGGSVERRMPGGPNIAYREILAMRNPHSKYQLLCSNCNQSKRRLGVCEHEIERRGDALGASG